MPPGYTTARQQNIRLTPSSVHTPASAPLRPTEPYRSGYRPYPRLSSTPRTASSYRPPHAPLHSTCFGFRTFSQPRTATRFPPPISSRPSNAHFGPFAPFRINRSSGTNSDRRPMQDRLSISPYGTHGRSAHRFVRPGGSPAHRPARTAAISSGICRATRRTRGSTPPSSGA